MGRWSLTGMSPASAALPGAETGTGAGVDIEGGTESHGARAVGAPAWGAEDASLPAAVPPLWGADATGIAFVTDSGSIARILAYLGEPTKAPYIAPTACGPPWEKDFDTREGDTFVLSKPLPLV